MTETFPITITVRTHYKGQMKEAISENWKVRTWKSDGSITFYKNRFNIIFPIVWSIDVNNEIPASIKAALLDALTQPLYSIGTWDPELEAFTPQEGVPAFNLTRAQLVSSMRQLQDCGYSCHRFRSRDETGALEEWASDSDPSVMINRTDGMPEYEILEMWKR